MTSINFSAMVHTCINNSPYFQRLQATPDLTEISKQVIRNNAQLFAAPSELVELKSRVTASIDMLKGTLPLHGRRATVICALASLLPITVIAAVATAIFGKLLVAAIFTGAAILLCVVIKKQAVFILDQIMPPLRAPLISAFRKSVEWTKEFAKRQDINALSPECKEAFADAQAKVDLLLTNLMSFKLKEELGAIDLRKLIHVGLNRA